jgi:hypothetical protein
MLIEPSPSMLIRTVSRQLQSTIADNISDPGLKNLVVMMGAVLDAAATRVDNETAWIKEENQQIELATAELAAVLPDGHLLQTALDAYRDNTPPAGDAEQRSAYLRTGALLSAAIDAAQNEPELLRPLERLLQMRIEREAAIIGGVSLVGRS